MGQAGEDGKKRRAGHRFQTTVIASECGKIEQTKVHDSDEKGSGA
jgi:hypothetical protein